MKKLLALIVFITISMYTTVQAQGWASDVPAIQKMILDFGDDLNLSEEQIADLLAVGMDRRSEVERRQMGMRSDRQRGNWRDGQRENMDRRQGVQRQRAGEQGVRSGMVLNPERRAHSEEMHQKVNEILTEEQAEKLHSLRVERMEKQHELRTIQNRRLAEQAGITGDKAEDVTSLLNRQSELRMEMQVLRLTPADGPDRDAMMELMEQIRNSNDEMKNLLTASEYEKLRSMMRPVRQQRGAMMRARR
ncbi:MAG: hypothetical protein EA390_03850 [Balneolaceae bacterium]|nr:MAG: hypothetical protein EA390_03850 [Balneolaceae bacterium]